MFDQSSSQRSYRYNFDDNDTEVIDVEEPPRRPRVPTAELTVHVLHEGARHRRLPDLSATSCGERYHAQFTPVLREELTHRDAPLCRDGCFTDHELDIADREERERQP